jgi:hypothetical protein
MVLTLSSLDFLLTRAEFAGTDVTKLPAHRSSTLLSAFNLQAISYQVANPHDTSHRVFSPAANFFFAQSSTEKQNPTRNQTRSLRMALEFFIYFPNLFVFGT